jgi:DNA-binding transcriptional LysR family regulator
MCKTKWVIWCAPSHAFAEKRTLRWEDLSHTRLYAAGHDHEHSVLPRLLDHPGAAQIQPAQVVENITTALGMAQAGLGVTCSPSYVRPLADLFGLRMCRLIEPEVVRHLCIYTSAERPLSDAVSAMRERIEKSLPALFPS